MYIIDIVNTVMLVTCMFKSTGMWMHFRVDILEQKA